MSTSKTRNFRFEFEFTRQDGTKENGRLRVALDSVPKDAPVSTILLRFWNALASGNMNSTFYGMPLFSSLLGFTFTKIVEVGSGEWEEVERDDLTKQFPPRTRFLIEAHAQMDYERDGPRIERLGVFTPEDRTAQAAKLEGWRAVSRGESGWCDTAARAESVKFVVKVKDNGGDKRIVFEQPKPETGEAGEQPVASESKPEFPSPGWESAETVEVRYSSEYTRGQTVPRYRLTEEGNFEQFCTGCGRYEEEDLPETNPDNDDTNGPDIDG